LRLTCDEATPRLPLKRCVLALKRRNASTF
jgi:hypothetical protein